MSWYPSWIPRIPSFALPIPSNIQSRFLSFVLKKTLGHFLKPGQLDYSQIDSQIGSGYVQVSDLELSPEAINAYLEGLPVAFESGTITAVKARIPWPNPLASTLGFSVKGLDLVLSIAPHVAQGPGAGHATVDLSQSMVQAAENFLHHELDPKDEQALRQSVYEDTAFTDPALPGGLEAPSYPEERTVDGDPAGVSMFAALIENLLARFEFDAQDISLTLVHPDNMRIILKLDSLEYGTGTSSDIQQSSSSHPTLPTVTRSLSFGGLVVLADNLSPDDSGLDSADRTTELAISRSPSPTSTESSMDEETRFSMSQSMAFLPPRSPSPSASAASSMYQSAISVQSEHESDHDKQTLPATGQQTEFPSQRQILSFGTKDIVVRVQTPLAVAGDDSPFVSIDHDDLQLTVSVGDVALSLRPWHISAFIRLASATGEYGAARELNRGDAPDAARSGPPLRLSVEIGGVHVLLVPAAGHDDMTFFDAFFERPWRQLPPSHEHVRLDLASLTGSFTTLPGNVPGEGQPQQALKFQISDVTMFHFRSSPGDSHAPLEPLPLFIVDPALPLQYSQPHVHLDSSSSPHSLPRFETIPWAGTKALEYGVKLSRWRLPNKNGPDHHTALELDLLQTPLSKQLTVKLAPIHIRLDVGALFHGPLLPFVDQVLSLQTETLSSSFSSASTIHDSSDAARPLDNDSPHSTLPVRVECPCLRVSIACPSPAKYAGRRSGQLVVDVHNILLSNQALPVVRTAKFVTTDSPEVSPESVLLKVEFSRSVFAISSANSSNATSLVSVGPLLDDDTLSPMDHVLEPSVLVAKPPPRSGVSSSTTVVSIDIPSVCADITKSVVDDLQYWLDDLAQFIEQMNPSNLPNPDDSSREASMIGSRFFARSRSGSGTLQNKPKAGNAETILKLKISEVFIRAMVPRQESNPPDPRPFVVTGSDLDILVELNVDNKHQNVVTLSVLGVEIQNHLRAGEAQTLLRLTSPRSLAHAAKPMVKINYATSTAPGMTSKEATIKLLLDGITYTIYPDIEWTKDLAVFAKNPPGTFESVIPSDRTTIILVLSDSSIVALAPSHPGSLVFYSQDLRFTTDLTGAAGEATFDATAIGLSLLAIDNLADIEQGERTHPLRGLSLWTGQGYALVVEINDLKTRITQQANSHPAWKVVLEYIKLRLHLCADTMSSVTPFIADFTTAFNPEPSEPRIRVKTSPIVTQRKEGGVLTQSIDDLAFKKMPQVGPTPDMIYDDLPTNPDYLDESFGAAGGLREMRDDDLDDFDDDAFTPQLLTFDDPNIVSRTGGETIKIFEPKGLEVLEEHFLTIPPDTTESRSGLGDPELSVRVLDGDVTLLLYDGYDWARTRKTIEEGVKEMRKRLTKIKQLVAEGQMGAANEEDTSALLFNSVYLGLEQDEDILGEPATLIAAIDEELRDDSDAFTQSSWQPLRPSGSSKPKSRSMKVRGKKLTRSRAPSMEFCFSGLQTEFDKLRPDDPLVSRTFVTVRDVEILDHIKTSTWKKFLTTLRSDSKGNVRETGSNMVRIELRSVRPVQGNHGSEEARLRAKILPLRLYVDQDAVDFLKKFFSFQDTDEPKASEETSGNEAYIQLAEIFPIDLKLDYKPRRVDYKALKEGRTIELMNFFHFDGAEMTLRHITLAGVVGWPRLFEMLNDLWTPDVKATQLVDVVSGVAPIRSVVNVGSGVADLILLPISQYKKDGRIVRGIQKGATAFVKSTATEAIKLGARLATGTQVILEQTENVLGGQLEGEITAEPVLPTVDPADLDDYEASDLISKYAEQPGDLKEGVQSAYKSLRRNFSSAAQTILAVPMEVYERSGNEGPVRAVIRAVPIAILKPMIGASEAVSKTLLGLHNTLDPDVRHENEAKYKLR